MVESLFWSLSSTYDQALYPVSRFHKKKSKYSLHQSVLQPFASDAPGKPVPVSESGKDRAGLLMGEPASDMFFSAGSTACNLTVPFFQVICCTPQIFVFVFSECDKFTLSTQSSPESVLLTTNFEDLERKRTARSL